MNDTILKAENISKQYRLGLVGSGTLRDDFKRFVARVRGQEDPFLKVGAVNDRSTKSNSDYVWALRDINFEVKRGEVLGIIGKNGAGKSTLLKILSRVTAPTTGNIKSKGRIASLLEVGTGFNPELTGRENIYLNGAILGMTKSEITLKLDEIIDFSGCERYIDTPTKRYSSGMTVRLAFAVAAHLEPEILVVDEVLAVGDAEFQKKAIGKMKDISQGQGRTVLFVSHDMNAIASLTERVIVLEHGDVSFTGETKAAINNYLSGKKAGLEYFNQVKSKAPSIQEVKLYTSLEGNNHEHGKKMLVEFVINLPSEMKFLALSYQVLDEMQVPILHSWQIDSSENIARKKGVLKITCEIPKVRLYIGNYSLRVHLSDSKTKEKFDFLDGVCPFEIKMIKNMRSDYNWVRGTAKYIEDSIWY